MIRFMLAKHTRNESDLVEVFDDDKFIACIYPNDQAKGIVVLTKYLTSTLQVHIDLKRPASVNIIGITEDA